MPKEEKLERKGNHSNYLDHCRDQAIAEAGKAEAMGFNCRALRNHIKQVDAFPMPEWERDHIETEIVVFERPIPPKKL